MRAALLLSLLFFIGAVAAAFGLPVIRLAGQPMTGLAGFLTGSICAAIPPVLVAVFRRMRPAKEQTSWQSKHPPGIKSLSVLLFVLAPAGFANAWVFLMVPVPELPKSLGVVALAYGVTALASAIGLWKLRFWSVLALRAWMVSCILVLAVFYISLSHKFPGGYNDAAIAVFSGCVIFIFYRLNRYVSANINSIA